METVINNLEELNTWTGNFLETLNQKKHATIITLSGDLGTGKTTLTQIVAEYLGITETVTSPTFVIQKEYDVLDHTWISKMIHIDAYRLEHKKDLEYLGWEAMIKNPENLIIIEWPEMVSGIDMPEKISIDIAINSDHTRTINKA